MSARSSSARAASSGDRLASGWAMAVRTSPGCTQTTVMPSGAILRECAGGHVQRRLAHAVAVVAAVPLGAEGSPSRGDVDHPPLTGGQQGTEGPGDEDRAEGVVRSIVTSASASSRSRSAARSLPASSVLEELIPALLIRRSTPQSARAATCRPSSAAGPLVADVQGKDLHALRCRVRQGQQPLVASALPQGRDDPVAARHAIPGECQPQPPPRAGDHDRLGCRRSRGSKIPALRSRHAATLPRSAGHPDNEMPRQSGVTRQITGPPCRHLPRKVPRC